MFFNLVKLLFFAVEKFNDYMFGQKTIVHTNRKPLASIVKKPLHLVPKRLQGMKIHFQKYDLEIQYEHGNMQTLYRAYLSSHTQVESE